MFEYIGQAFMQVNLLGMGAYIIMLALSFGISRLISNGNMETLIISMMIINYTLATIIFVGTQESAYYLLTTFTLVIILVLPDGTKDIILKPR